MRSGMTRKEEKIRWVNFLFVERWNPNTLRGIIGWNWEIFKVQGYKWNIDESKSQKTISSFF